MIKRKDGTINNIVYDHTVYHNGEYCLLPNIAHMIGILEEIYDTNETTENIWITPFYRNHKAYGGEEFDEYMFYVECRQNVTKEEIENFPIENIWIKIQQKST